MHAHDENSQTTPNIYTTAHIHLDRWSSANPILADPFLIDQQQLIPDLRICVEFVSMETRAGHHTVVGPFSIETAAQFKRRFSAIRTNTWGLV